MTSNRQQAQKDASKGRTQGADHTPADTESLAALNIVVLGATGDLAKRETYPVLFKLHQRGQLPSVAHITGYARSEWSDEEFRKNMREALEGDEKEVEAFLDLCHYVHGPYDKDEGYEQLLKDLESVEQDAAKKGSDKPLVGRLFYLAVPPSVYVSVCQFISKFFNLKDKSHVSPSSWMRVVIEKPFGKDLQSSEEMADELDKVLSEDQIFRIDHFVGMELTQSVLLLRFANRPYASVWDRHNIEFIEVIGHETLGTAGRGGYFDEYGLIRDVMQNHLIQLLTYSTMEAPKSMGADDVRDEKARLLKCIDPIDPKQCVLGQYAKSADGKKPGYAEDTEVDKDSKTVTYAAVRLNIHNERWEGVPIILKVGKALDEDLYAVRVVFKAPETTLFGSLEDKRTEIILRFMPDAIALKLVTRAPGMEPKVETSTLEMPYSERYKPEEVLAPYERLVLDAITGCPEHFVRRDELKAAWEIFTPLLKAIDESGIQPEPYENGSSGPASADAFCKALGNWQNDYKWGAKEQ